MALLSPRALASTGRVVRRIAVGPRIEGSRQTVEVTGADFRCRLVPVPSREVRGEHGQVRLVERANLVAVTEDIRASDEVRVGGEPWRVVGGPETVRTRRMGVASVVALERLAEPEPTELVA